MRSEGAVEGCEDPRRTEEGCRDYLAEEIILIYMLSVNAAAHSEA